MIIPRGERCMIHTKRGAVHDAYQEGEQCMIQIKRAPQWRQKQLGPRQPRPCFSELSVSASSLPPGQRGRPKTPTHTNHNTHAVLLPVQKRD
jgi:hypothetical protein